MKSTEEARVFSVAGEQLLGVVVNPDVPSDCGVLIIVGGPQYRVGSHRQFALLSRAVASAGYTTMRFDYRGMGDSSGDMHDFEAVSEDIGAAIDVFLKTCPSIKRVVLWGLCDAASAALLYLYETGDPRVAGLVLINPWVRSETSLAQTHIKHYYRQRLLELEFWKKLLRGELQLLKSVGDLLHNARQARSPSDQSGREESSFQTRMARGLRQFSGPVLFILSGQDFTAKEFQEFIEASTAWAGLVDARNVQTVEHPEADHTFSSRDFRAAVEVDTIDFLNHV